MHVENGSIYQASIYTAGWATKMGNIHDVFKPDDVNGEIIGGDFCSGRLFYDGRPQVERIFSDTEENLKTELLAELSRIKQESGDVYYLIYPANTWEIRIDAIGLGH